MSGESISIVADADSVIAFVFTFLNDLPAESELVLVDGTAIFCRLGAMTRPTRAADTIARDQDLEDEVAAIWATLEQQRDVVGMGDLVGALDCMLQGFAVESR